MEIKINGIEIHVYPTTFNVTVADLDNGETSGRTADGRMYRDRIAVKRKLEMSFGMLKWEELSAILQLVKDEFFEVYYPDTESGQYETRTFYCGDRTAGIAVLQDNVYYWNGLKLTLVER